MSDVKLNTGSVFEITSAREGLRFGNLRDLDNGKEYWFEMYEDEEHPDGTKISGEDIRMLTEGDLLIYELRYDDDAEVDMAFVLKLNK